MTREIVLDTETTGMDPALGHKVIEIGCVELENHLPTGRTYHTFINPERAIDAGATAVHGITDAKVADAPIFAEIAGDLMDFIGTGKLVIHNAAFDVKFLNAELGPFGYTPIRLDQVIDTLLMARQKFPGSPANLDALCRRFGIDLSERTLHGALLDARLLAEVYLELLGGRQQGMVLETIVEESLAVTPGEVSVDLSTLIVVAPSAEELEHHAKLLEKLKKPLWKSLEETA